MFLSVNSVLIFILLLQNLGYFAYYMWGGDRSLGNLFSVLLSLGILTLIVPLFPFKKLERKTPVALFILFILFLLGSVIQSAFRYPVEAIIPTLNRVVLVFLMGYLSFSISTRTNAGSWKLLDRYVLFWSVFLFVIACYQVFIDDLIFKNGAYRLSSIYGEYVTGLALMASTMAIYSFFRVLTREWINIIPMALSCFMVVGTESRLSVVSIFLSVCAAYVLVENRLLNILKYIFLGVFVFALGIILILNTTVSERLKLTIQNGLTDNSILHRLDAWVGAISGMSFLELFTGVGLGGFNLHYYSQSGILGMAAHNDYVQIFVEAGVLALVTYVTFQAWVLIRLRYLAVSSDSQKILGRMAIAVFINGFIFSSLHNPYYYFESLSFSAVVVGSCFGALNSKIKRKAYHVI